MSTATLFHNGDTDGPLEFVERVREPTKEKGRIVNALSVDIEDYFQVQAFANTIDRSNWDTHPHRVVQNTEKVLEIFSDGGVKGTFFTLGWVAERYPELIQRIVAEGHELASHGMAHFRVHEQTPDAFREDIRCAKKLLEDTGGVAVTGYRAATFSIGEQNLWAFDILAEEGYQYSSSINPIHHNLYGMPNAPRFGFYPTSRTEKENGIIEFPITTIRVGNTNRPCGGGGFFRLFPYALSRWAMRRVNRLDNQPCIFYFHPWEVDPDQPWIPNISAKTKFRHYLNLKRMEARLRQMTTDFAWDRMDRVFDTQSTANS
jgi:polysaccharide deacetylase family protein (PEP-CTERM system associated)